MLNIEKAAWKTQLPKRKYLSKYTKGSGVSKWALSRTGSLGALLEGSKLRFLRG